MIASFELGAGQLLVSEAELVSKVGLVSAGVGAGGVIYQWNVRQTPHSRLTLCPADRFSYSTHRALHCSVENVHRDELLCSLYRM